MNLINVFIANPLLIRLFIAFLVLLTFLGAKRLLSRISINFLSQIRIKEKRLDIHFFDVLQKPFNCLFLFSGIYLSLAISPFVYYNVMSEETLILGNLNIPISFLSISILNKVYYAFFVGIITWIVYDLEHIYEELFSEFNSRTSLIDNTLFIRYISRIIRFITVAFGFSLILIILIPNLSSIITGLGIGGAALALVAKDSIANIFSGMILLLDKPFIIGDWVEINTTEGIVEDISFRSTRIRTFTQGLMVIPNSTVGNANVINWSRMNKRRVKFMLGVSYDTTTEQITSCTSIIREYLQNHCDIDADSVLVHFENFGDYTLNIQIVYFVLKTDYPSYLKVKEDVNIKIIKICEHQGINIAFPTQTLIVQQSSLDNKYPKDNM